MSTIIEAINKAVEHQLGLQYPEGYWWYTLEANETISAEFIFLMYFLGEIDHEIEAGLVRRILSRQRSDGTWALYFKGQADLSTTIECYWALKLAINNPLLRDIKDEIKSALDNARSFIIDNGGITKARVFTKIHMAIFGLAPWHACPAMPVQLMLMPTWAPINIYEFSSWARSCIIPLLIVLNKKPVRPILINGQSFSLDELYCEEGEAREWSFKINKPFLSWERFFVQMDKSLKLFSHLPKSPFEPAALKKCEEWICEHISRTEDIFPALSYSAIALSSLGHPSSHPVLKKSLDALKNFQQRYQGPDLTSTVSSDNSGPTIHQQCCISPVWDTPWQITALLDSRVSPDHPALIKSGQWLMSKQITNVRGDWRFKNPDAEAGGWSFEFENEYFPDTDDTIQVLHVLDRLKLPEAEKSKAIKRGIAWLLSMQNDDGGFAAFDKNNDLSIVNKIPFSDHGACLDESCPDITGRLLALLPQLKDRIESKQYDKVIGKAIEYLEVTQEHFGGWFGRWGVNYIYGTWCVLTGLKAMGLDMKQPFIQNAINWLKSIQHKDGGWSESPESYKVFNYLPYYQTEPVGVPSQTAWAVMGLVNAGEHESDAVKRGIDFLISRQNSDGSWEEEEYTGTGFPGHFYIRYHGYRHFFPLLALAKRKLALALTTDSALEGNS